MSLQQDDEEEDESSSQMPDLNTMNEEQQIAYAMQMSLSNSGEFDSVVLLVSSVQLSI